MGKEYFKGFYEYLEKHNSDGEDKVTTTLLDHQTEALKMDSKEECITRSLNCPNSSLLPDISAFYDGIQASAAKAKMAGKDDKKYRAEVPALFKAAAASALKKDSWADKKQEERFDKTFTSMYNEAELAKKW